MSRGELTPSIESSDKKVRMLDLKNMKTTQVNGKGKKRAFDLSMASESDEDERNLSDINGANETNGDGFNESALVQNEDDVSQMLPEDGNQSGEQDLPLGGSEGEITEVIPETTTTNKRRPGRPPKVASTDPVASQNALSEQKKGRGRPPKKAKKDVNGNGNVAQEESSEAAAAADQEAESAAPGKSRDPKTAVSERPSNTKMKPPPKPTAKSSLTKPKGSKTASDRPKRATLITVRGETPADDNGSLRMKSGRTSIKPLAYWRNERAVYEGDGNIVGDVITLRGLTEVIRIEEPEVPRPKRYNRKTRPKRQVKSEEEDEDERAPWENETGIMRAQVMQWDHAIGKYDEENTEETGEHSRFVSIPGKPH